MTGGFSLEYTNYTKISPNLPGRACTSSCGCHQQLRRCPYALFRDRNFRYFQCSLRFFLRLSEDKPWNMDLHISGTSGTGADDPAEKFVVQYLFSFVVGFVFEGSCDVHELWINVLPTAIGWRIFYFIASYILICIGIAISNRCKMPIVPTDLFPRELSQITSVAYPKIKISFDVICLIVTAALTGFGLGHIKGLGIGTVVAAFTMGKGVGIAGNWLDKHMDFTSFLAK